MFDLLVDKPADWSATEILVLLGAIYGALGGLLLTLLLYPENLAEASLPVFVTVEGPAFLIKELALIRRLGLGVFSMLCPECLTYCGPRRVRQSGLCVTYYGCRTCGQSRQFLHCPQGVIAVLGTASSVSTKNQHDGLLRINWLTRRTLFDFEQVEIIQATDEDVARFSVQVGNDTDPVRQPHYAQMQCFVAPQCQLSENSLRVLEIMFGQVEHGEVVVK